MIVREVTRVIVINHRVTRDSRASISHRAALLVIADVGLALAAAMSGFMIGRDGIGMNNRYLRRGSSFRSSALNVTGARIYRRSEEIIFRRKYLRDVRTVV